MIKRAMLVLIPIALFVGWWWMIMGMIEDMSQQRASDRFHAMILGCEYQAELPGEQDVLIFMCDGKVELHKRVPWK